jgi:hypothetical protein
VLVSGSYDKTVKIWFAPSSGSLSCAVVRVRVRWCVCVRACGANSRFWRVLCRRDCRSRSFTPIQTLSEAKDSVSSLYISSEEIITAYVVVFACAVCRVRVRVCVCVCVCLLVCVVSCCVRPGASFGLTRYARQMCGRLREELRHPNRSAQNGFHGPYVPSDLLPAFCPSFHHTHHTHTHTRTHAHHRTRNQSPARACRSPMIPTAC